MPPHLDLAFESGGSAPSPTSAAVTLPPIVPKAIPIPRKIAAIELQKTLATLRLANDGDGNERTYWPVIIEHFPNYERFWRELVVRMTRRFESALDSPGRHERRDHITRWDSGVSERLPTG